MENKKNFKYSYSLVFTQQPYFSPVRSPGYRFIYRTEKIQNPTTTREIFKSSKSFLKEKIAEYNNYEKEGEKPIITTYKLYIRQDVEEGEKQQIKDLYETIYKIEDGVKIQIEEKKKYLHLGNIQPNFYIYIEPTVYFFRERKYNPKENEDEDILKIGKCVRCRKNPTNVLFKRCYHRVVCESCDNSNNYLYCPLCKNSLKGTRKMVFFRGNASYTTETV